MPSSKKPRKRSTSAPKRDPQSGPTASIDFQAAPRAAQALRLRRMGYTYDTIASMVGYSDERNARRAVKNAGAKIVREEAKELINYQLDMLASAFQVVCKRIERDDESSLWAVDRLIPLLKRQAELMGLDAPKPDATQGAQMLVIPIAADVLEAV